MLVLTVLQGPDKSRRFELPDTEPQLIGRSSEALDLADQTISRRHAELTPEGDGRWYIRDLKSANGTYVNGVRVTERRLLRPGDQVRTGGTLFVYGEHIPSPAQGALRMAEKGEMDISLEHAVDSNDESMIMSVPDPSQAAQFQLRVIYELTSVISSVTDRESLMEGVMDLIFEYFQADRGFILLRADPHDPTSQPEPFVVRYRDQPESNLASKAKEPAAVSRTIVQYVTRKGVGVLSSNAMTDKRFAAGDSVQSYHIHSAMCVPIKFKDRFYGVIHLDSQVANYTYTEDQLKLLTAIGVQTGMALSNLRLVDARLRAERLAAVGQTVASLSHSIKNILQGMRGGADVVELGLKKNDINLVNSGWAIVDRNLDRIYELTMNMLTFSKQRKPDLEMRSIGPLIQEVVDLVQPQFEGKQVALVADVPEDLPPVPMESSGMHQAILNLLNNALDAVEPESGVVSLHAAYDARHQRVSLRVTDNGQGMTDQVRRRLFEPFHSTKGYQGTGLGLVVTRKIVDEHGGKIVVDSQPEAGTTFTLTLPTSPRSGSSADTQGPSPSQSQPDQHDPQDHDQLLGQA